jgi:hypothetical protein
MVTMVTLVKRVIFVNSACLHCLPWLPYFFIWITVVILKTVVTLVTRGGLYHH